MPASSLILVRDQAARAGINLFGLVDAARFDRCQPKERRLGNVLRGCGTALVLGTAGRGLLQNQAESSSGPQNGEARALAAVRATAIASRAAGPCTLVLAGAGAPVNFARLGEAAGFGTVSPVSGLFLHPEFGPWLRVRAALLFPGQPFGAIPEASIADRFHPCCSCARPCLAACPAAALDGAGGQHAGHCEQHRLEGGCEQVCCSRHACPLGAAHRDAPEVPLHGHDCPAKRRVFRVFAWLRRVTLVVRGRLPG